MRNLSDRNFAILMLSIAFFLGFFVGIISHSIILRHKEPNSTRVCRVKRVVPKWDTRTIPVQLMSLDTNFRENDTIILDSQEQPVVILPNQKPVPCEDYPYSYSR